MSYLIWSPAALEDVQRLYRFLAEKDIEAAKNAALKIDKGAELLENTPEAGRPAIDLEPEQRELLIPFGASGYLLLYEVLGDIVHVLAVRHQKEVGY